MEFIVGFFFFFFLRLASIGNKIGNIIFCFVNIQHIIMLKNGMIVHGNYAMVFVIHNKAFPILNALILLFFPIVFLVDKMAHNTPHLLRFRKVYNNR